MLDLHLKVPKNNFIFLTKENTNTLELSKEQKQTINRRRDELISGKIKGVNWDTVKEILK